MGYVKICSTLYSVNWKKIVKRYFRMSICLFNELFTFIKVFDFIKPINYCSIYILINCVTLHSITDKYSEFYFVSQILWVQRWCFPSLFTLEMVVTFCSLLQFKNIIISELNRYIVNSTETSISITWANVFLILSAKWGMLSSDTFLQYKL